jgi:Domain of unknown function (DUF4252)
MRTFLTTLICSMLLFSCKSEPSLEKYFVENTENKNFVQLDVSPNILNLDKSKLSLEQSNAVKSFDKMNVLAFKLNGENKTQFETERAKVSNILKDKKYQQLMKFGSGKEGGSVSFVGDDEHISEFVLFGNKNEAGFAVVRVLGKDMNPTSIFTMITALKNSDMKLEQLKPLLEMMKK